MTILSLSLQLSSQIIAVYDYLKQSNQLYLAKREVRQFLYDAFKSELSEFCIGGMLFNEQGIHYAYNWLPIGFQLVSI